MAKSSDCCSKLCEGNTKGMLQLIFKSRYSQLCDDIPSSDLQSLSAKLYSADIISTVVREKTTSNEVFRAVEASLKANLNPSSSDEDAMQFVADLLAILETDTSKKPIALSFRDEAESKGITVPSPSSKTEQIIGTSSAALCSERRESKSFPMHSDKASDTNKTHQPTPSNTPPSSSHYFSYDVGAQSSTRSHRRAHSVIVGGSSLVMMGHGQANNNSSAVFPLPLSHSTTQDSGNATHKSSKQCYSDHEENEDDKPHSITSEASGIISDEALRQHLQYHGLYEQLKVERVRRKNDRLETHQFMLMKLKEFDIRTRKNLQDQIDQVYKDSEDMRKMQEQQIEKLEDKVEKQQLIITDLLKQNERLKQRNLELSEQRSILRSQLERASKEKTILQAEARERRLREQYSDMKYQFQKTEALGHLKQEQRLHKEGEKLCCIKKPLHETC